MISVRRLEEIKKSDNPIVWCIDHQIWVAPINAKEVELIANGKGAFVANNGWKVSTSDCFDERLEAVRKAFWNARSAMLHFKEELKKAGRRTNETRRSEKS